MHRYQVGDQPKLGFVVRQVIPGGMGVIYVVEITHMGSSLMRVIKSCDVEKGMELKFREKLKQESLLWISLPAHPHVVRAFSFEFDGGLPSLNMEYLSGGNLRDRMNAGALSRDEALRIVTEFCNGMVFLAGEHGIVHRDIKPENVLFDDTGRVKITDFGLARAYERGTSGEGPVADATSAPHVISGTLPYMSPEQLAGVEGVDTRADVYAFGVMFYELLVGRRPFEASDVAGYARKISEGRMGSWPQTVPDELRAIITRCLAADRTGRYSDFTQLRQALMEFSAANGISQEPERAASDDESSDSLDPHDWNNRGYAFVQAGDLEQALQCYRNGLADLRSRPRSSDYVVTPGVARETNASDALFALLQGNMGSALMRLGRFEEARKAFQAALEVVPDDGASYLRLGQIAIFEGNTEAGLSLIKKGAECEPGNYDLLLKYVRACLAHSKGRECEQAFNQFLDGKRSDGPFMVATGCLLDDEFGLAPALRCFDAALAFNPDLSSAWYNRGVALHRADRGDDAIKSYENAIRLDRTHVFARCYLGLLLVIRGRHKEGVLHLQKFLEIATSSPLTEMVKVCLQGAQMGLPLDALLKPLSLPQVIKHVV